MLLLVRLALAAITFPQGAQEVLGWFGGYRPNGTLAAFTSKMHIPTPLAIAAFAAELHGAVGVALGLFTRLSAVGIGATMLVAASISPSNRFLMNWSGTQRGEGVEHFVPLIALSILLVIEGAGAIPGSRS